MHIILLLTDKIPQIDLWPGLHPGPRWGSLRCSPIPLIGLEGGHPVTPSQYSPPSAGSTSLLCLIARLAKLDINIMHRLPSWISACRNRNCRNTACRNSACRNRNLSLSLETLTPRSQSWCREPNGKVSFTSGCSRFYADVLYIYSVNLHNSLRNSWGQVYHIFFWIQYWPLMLINIFWPLLGANKDDGPIRGTGSIFSCRAKVCGIVLY